MSFWLTLCCVQGQPVNFSFPQFTNTSGLLLHGAAAVQGGGIDMGGAREFRSAGAWYQNKAFLEAGFSTAFAFQIPSGTREGFAFVIQNNPVTAVGAGGKGLGYEGVANSVAIEFDARRNPEHVDLAAGHISLQTRGAYPNLASHSASLGASASSLAELIDGNLHVATIHYRPGRLQVFLDSTNVPRLEVRCDLSKLINLENGQAWIGFTADGALLNARLTSWSFVPAAGPAVGFSSPQNNATFVFGATVGLASTGTVSRVDFFDGPALLASDTAPPFQFNWNGASPGIHFLTAVGYAADGRRSTTAPLKVTVAAVQSPIGINFSRGVSGTNYPLAAAQLAGVVPQSQWNNVVPTTGPGNGSTANLRDGNGNLTLAAVQFQFNGPADEPGVDVTLSADHELMRAYLANNALVFPVNPSFVKVSQIPFSAYDVIVYSDSDNRNFDRLTEFHIGTDSIFLRDQAYATFSGQFAEARGVANLGLNTSAGNYVRFRGLTNDNFTLDVLERSFADYTRRAVVNGIQIVPAAPGPATRTVQVVRGPYMQSGAPNAMTVCWRTDRPTNSVVRYGLTAANLNLSASDSEIASDHAVRITGLTADTRYYYALGATGTNFPASAENYFVTSPPQSKPVRLWVIGDAGTGDYGEASMREAFLDYTRDHKPDLTLLLGDNAYNNGADAEYQTTIFDMFGPTLAQTVLWSCMGNHETYTQDMPYFRIFNFPTNGEVGGVPSGSESYYSWNYGNVHFVCLESTIADRTPTGPMVTWLRADLAANTKQWLIAYFHAPPYSKGSHDSDEPIEIEMIDMRQNVLPVLQDYGVDLILSGNSHGYERSMMVDGHYGTSDTFLPEYIIQGGSGQPDDTGAYVKPNLGVVPHSGTVCVVAGNAGVVRGDYGMTHPVMARGVRKLGSLLLDIDGPNLEARLVCDNGSIGDYFSIRKGIPTNATPQVSLSARTSILGEAVPSSTVFDVRRTGPTNDALRVFYRISGTAENGRDFLRLPNSVVIPAGQQSMGISVTPIDDADVEGPENLTLTLETNTALFRLVVLPDTRTYLGQTGGGTPGMLDAQTRWITSQADLQKIACVLHTGDITESNSAAEWALAQAQLQLPVPFAVVPGDHDGLSGPVAQTAGFNTTFPVAAARGRSEFGGTFESNKLDNAYYYFSAGGLDWMVLALEFIPRDAVLDWANRIVAANPQRKVIVLTHAWVTEDDSLPVIPERGRENAPAQVWEKLVRRHANIAFVFSGHTEGHGVGRRVDVGDYGNKVVQLAANFSGQLNGGNGYLRILEFDPAADRLRVQTYSPYLDASMSDTNNQFDVPDLGLFKPWHGRYVVGSVSNTATVTMQDNDVDTVRPTLVSAVAAGPSNQIVLRFSELVNEQNARDPANYFVNSFLVTSATLLADGKTVVLTLGSAMQDGATYTINVSNIRDRAASPNLIAAGANASFTHRLSYLFETFDDRNFPGWQIVDEGTIDAPSIWRAPTGKLDQSSSIYGPDALATENRQGTYVYWSRSEALGWNNYIMRATLRTADEDAVGLLFWFQDSANYYKLEFDRRNSFYRLMALTSGFELLLAEESGTFPLNSDLRVSVEAMDDRIYATLNGEPLFGGIVTNAASGIGTVGLYCWQSAGVTFDDVEVVPSPPNSPPTVTITAPAPNTAFLATNLALSANASDADGVRDVRFFAGEELIGVAHQGPPYNIVWSNVPPGEYALTAIAHDMRGFSAVSSPVQVHALLLDQTFDSGGLIGWTVRDEGSFEGPSNWQIAGGKMLQLSNIYGPTAGAVANRAGTFAYWDNPTAYRWRDYLLTATLTSSDDDGIGLLFRYRDANNYYKLEFDAQRGFRKLLRKLNGVETTLAADSGSYLVNVPFAVQVKVVDGKTEVRVDGTLLFGGAVSDGTIPIGTIGLYAWGNPGA
ncbi:MAG TPA: metallophosphoesterase, partial [Verrucomicrobiae bacterium]|nr:metallophosphoesterase [Verrucomicrobiae bacterium]